MESSDQERIKKNNLYYDKFSENVENRTENRDYSEYINLFTQDLDKEKYILDIGCGTGHHLEIFKDMGFKCLGIEPSQEMRKICHDKGLEVIEGSFEELDKLELPDISGIWCAASLLHVPQEILPEVINKLSNLLQKEQKLFFTLRVGNSSKWDKYDDESGEAERFIQLFETDYLKEVLEKSNFKISFLKEEDSYWGRPSKWVSIIANKII